MNARKFSAVMARKLDIVRQRKVKMIKRRLKRGTYGVSGNTLAKALFLSP